MSDNPALRFEVEGSKGDLYAIVFERIGVGLRATCTCEAGQRGINCRHRYALLMGDCDDVVSENDDDLPKIADLIAGTEVKATLDTLVVAEKVAEEAHTVVKNLKAKLGRLMNGPKV